MSESEREEILTLEIETPVNGRIRKSTVAVLDQDKLFRASDVANLESAPERRRVAKEIARQLSDPDADKWHLKIETKYAEIQNSHRRMLEQQAAGSAEAAAIETVQLLEIEPRCIRRPLTLIDGQAFAAAWVTLRRERTQSVENNRIVPHDPPLTTTEKTLLIVAGDGTLYADGGLPGAKPLRELGLDVRLSAPPPPDRGWSGAGVNRYVAGKQADPAETFRRVAGVVDRFVDFARSFASQETLCEMTACYVVSTYLLDALNVVGYLWPNGERGSGKTQFLQVVSEMAYLGQVILAGSSYPCLRDFADYGATLAFDDAEAVMDVRRTDPDKRTLLLAGNRRGATIAVKELVGDKWETRHVNTFCPRLFSAIRLPDEVLGSRSIVVPLVRSGDPRRSKANPMDPHDWPTDRHRLVDDLWGLGLAHLPTIPLYARVAAENAELSGRNLDPWRPVLAIAAWLDDRHGLAGLYDRMEKLSRDYQSERGEIEEADRTRVLLRSLLRLSEGWIVGEPLTLKPAEIAKTMCAIAEAEDLAEGDKAFTTPSRVGRLMLRQRFRRPAAKNAKARTWELTRDEIVSAAATYGIDEQS